MLRSRRASALLRLSVAVHGAALAGAVLVPRIWEILVGAVVANQALLCAGGLRPRSKLLGPNLSRLPSSFADRRVVALTFDDGPDPRVTPRVLDLLQEYGVTASFFCIGRRVEQHPDLAAEMSRRGHGLENHTYHHRHLFAFKGPRGLVYEIDRAQEAIHNVTGRRPQYFRAPAGIRSPLLEPLLASRDLHLVSWTRRGLDGVDQSPSRVLRRLTRRLSAGDLLVLHDGRSWGSSAAAHTILEVLPRLLEALAARDLEGIVLPDRSALTNRSRA